MLEASNTGGLSPRRSPRLTVGGNCLWAVSFRPRRSFWQDRIPCKLTWLHCLPVPSGISYSTSLLPRGYCPSRGRSRTLAVLYGVAGACCVARTPPAGVEEQEPQRGDPCRQRDQDRRGWQLRGRLPSRRQRHREAPLTEAVPHGKDAVEGVGPSPLADVALQVRQPVCRLQERGLGKGRYPLRVAQGDISICEGGAQQERTNRSLVSAGEGGLVTSSARDWAGRQAAIEPREPGKHQPPSRPCNGSAGR